MNKFARSGSDGKGPFDGSKDQPIQWRTEPVEKQPDEIEKPTEEPVTGPTDSAQEQTTAEPTLEELVQPLRELDELPEEPTADQHEDHPTKPPVVDLPVEEPPAQTTGTASDELVQLMAQIEDLTMQVSSLRAEVSELRSAGTASAYDSEEEEEALTEEEELALRVLEEAVAEGASVQPAPESAQELDDEQIARILDEAASHATPTTNETGPMQEPSFDQVMAEPEAEYDVPAAFSARIEFEREAVAAVPAKLAIGALAIPVRIEEGTLVCKCAEPFDRPALDQIASATSMKVEPEAAPMAHVLAALRQAYREASRDDERESVAGIAETKGKGRFGRRAA